VFFLNHTLQLIIDSTRATRLEVLPLLVVVMMMMVVVVERVV
jgi:hypothetical protein